MVIIYFKVFLQCLGLFGLALRMMPLRYNSLCTDQHTTA